MLFMIIPDDDRTVISLVSILSIRVADVRVNLVGFKIRGRNPLENMPSIYIHRFCH